MRHAVAADLHRCVQLLVSAYAEDPFYRWLFPAEDTRPEALAAWFTRVSTNHLKFGHYYRSEDFSAVATWVPPDVPLNNASDWEEGRRLVASWTDDEHATRVYDAIAARGRSRPGGPSWQLIYVAIADEARGAGLGPSAVAPMLHMFDEQGFAVFYNATNTDNIPLLERVGFERLDPLPILDGPTFQPMYRKPRGGVGSAE